MKRWHLLYRNPHQDCLSNGSNGQIKQNLEKHYHQICKQFQVVQASVLSLPSSPIVLRRGPCLLTEKRIKVFETKYPKKLLRVSHLKHKTDDRVRNKFNFLLGLQEPLLATAKKRNLTWFWYVNRNYSFSKTVL